MNDPGGNGRCSLNDPRYLPKHDTARYRLRFFFDAGSGVCLWSGNDAARAEYGIAITAEQLPLPSATRQEIARLVAQYDTSFDWNDPAGPTPWSPEECASFNEAARALLQRLRAQLGPAYTVADESKRVELA